MWQDRKARTQNRPYTENLTKIIKLKHKKSSKGAVQS